MEKFCHAIKYTGRAGRFLALGMVASAPYHPFAYASAFCALVFDYAASKI